MCNLVCLGAIIYSVKNCNIWIIFLCIAITIGYLIAYVNLDAKLESWGREKEAQKQKEREQIRRTATAEELVLLAKQEKKRGNMVDNRSDFCCIDCISHIRLRIHFDFNVCAVEQAVYRYRKDIN